MLFIHLMRILALIIFILRNAISLDRFKTRMTHLKLGFSDPVAGVSNAQWSHEWILIKMNTGRKGVETRFRDCVNARGHQH